MSNYFAHATTLGKATALNNAPLLSHPINHAKSDSKVSAVFFDLDDTLIDSAPAWRAGLDAAFARLTEVRPELAREAIRAAWQRASGALTARLDAGALSVAQVRERRWREALSALAIADDTLAAELEATLAETFIGGLRLFKDTAVLDRLRGRERASGMDDHRRCHVGIITNGAADEALDSQYTKALRTGLLDRVDSFLASDAAGFRKPDPRIFALALERAGVAPDEAFYVGDSIRNDVVGANYAGMMSVLLWRVDEPLPALEGDERPAHVITSLAGLDGLLTQ